MISSKIRVLYFVDRFLQGGIQTLLWNIATSIDLDSFEIEFLCLDDGKSYPMEQDLADMGFKVTKLDGIWLDSPISFLRYRKALDAFFESSGHFDIVHVHSTGKNYQVLEAAKAFGSVVRILHSHNTGYMTSNQVKARLGNMLNRKASALTTNRFACGKEAGQWMFGDDFGYRPEDFIVRNAVDCSKYRYDFQIRQSVRDELNLDDEKRVCINIARLAPVKNHSFLLEAFSKALQQNKELVLLIVGDGALKDELSNKIGSLGISDNVKLLGFRKDVADLLQAADCFVMPSIHEGLPFVLVEAQAAGLPCLISDGVTKEAALLPTTVEARLDCPLSVWAERIAEVACAERFADPACLLAQRGYDLQTEIKRLEEYYRCALSS